MRARFDAVLRRIRLAFVLIALAIAGFGWASWLAFDRLATIAVSAVDMQDKLILLEQLNGSLSRTQAALREYLLSGEKDELEAFQARAWEQKNMVEMLGSPPRLREQEELERRVAERTQLQYEVAAIQGRKGRDAAIKALEAIRMRESDEELSALLSNIRTREERNWLTGHAEPLVRRAQWVVLGGGALLLAVFAWACWMAWRYELERRRVTSLLGDSEAMARSLTENMAEGLVILGEDLAVLAINPAALKVLGYAADELVGQPARVLLAPSTDRDILRAQLEARLALPDAFQIVDLDMMAVRKDGSRVPVQVSLNDLRLGGQRRVAALIRDVSRMRAASEAVRASEQHMREVTDTLPVLIAEFDTEHRFRFLNRACAEFLGRPGEEAVGRSALDLLGEALYAEHKPHLDRVLAGSSARYEVAAEAANGQLGIYDMHLIPRRDTASGELVGFYAFGTDITLLKRIDRMKTEFISTVSHELRTPLTSIRGSLGLMSAGVAGTLPAAAGNLVGIAQNNCDRLIRLINDILDSEKIESGDVPLRLQVVELAPVVRKALTDNEGFAQQRRVHLQMAAPLAPLAVKVDVDRLLQVLTNLLSNAVKFSPAHAEVDVRVCSTPASVRVEVSDQGPGIPLDFQRRIFQKFSQADSSDTRAKGGTGLGLNISRTLVERMGGRIGFTSTPGHGATFFFELPRHEAPQAAPPVVPRACAPAGTRKHRILHVDPDGDIRAIVSNLAEGCATCVSAGSLEDARQRLRESAFDLVLLEPDLADGSGWDLLAELEGREAPPPVIVFSAAHAEPPPGREVASLLVKSQTSEEGLVRAIERTLSGDVASIAAPLEH